MKTASFVMIAFFAAASASAHIVVAPPQSQTGASQVYKVRVHNEEKVATTSIDLDVPDGVTVVSVAPITTGTFTTTKAGDRIVKVTWQSEIPSGKYVSLHSRPPIRPAPRRCNGTCISTWPTAPCWTGATRPGRTARRRRRKSSAAPATPKPPAK